jgi:Zn-dependent protease
MFWREIMSIGLRIIEQLMVLAIILFAAVISITIHEFAHAFTSWRMGDNLPRFSGRLTLNPFSHIDIVGLIFMVSTCYISMGIMNTGFGWGKPVETSPKYYKDKQKGTILVGLSGPLTSFIFAILALIPYTIIQQKSLASTLNPLVIVLGTFLNYISVFSFNLALISLLPFRPFDGFMIWGKMINPKTQFIMLQFQNIIFSFFLLIILIPMTGQVLQNLINLITIIFTWSISNIVKLFL